MQGTTPVRTCPSALPHLSSPTLRWQLGHGVNRVGPPLCLSLCLALACPGPACFIATGCLSLLYTQCRTGVYVQACGLLTWSAHLRGSRCLWQTHARLGRTNVTGALCKSLNSCGWALGWVEKLLRPTLGKRSKLSTQARADAKQQNTANERRLINYPGESLPNSLTNVIVAPVMSV